MQWKFCSRVMAILVVLTVGLALVPGAWAVGSGKIAKRNKGTFAVLYNFAENGTDPLYPSGIIAQGRDGGLYSSTNVGGLYNLGTVFAITTAGQLSVPYNFTDPLDEYGGPGWGLTLSTDGTFYGACTYCGGGNGYGTVFEVTPSGDLTTLYDFTGQNEDAYPHAPPIQAADGWFYGTAAGDFYGHGSEVYRMTPSGDKVTLFHLNHRQGAAPGDPVVQGTDGNFYATTNGGGNNGNCGNSGCGVIFKITSKGHVAVLHDFESDEDDGFNPVAPLIQASDGYFYGTVPYGGVNYDYGTVFRISPSGKFKLLHIFNGYSDGRFPSAALVQATDGNFYGTTRQGGGAKSGVIFKITPQGRFSVIYNFDGTTSAYPLSALVQHTNGKLYGETTGYQINGGTFYSLDLGLGPFVGLLSSLGRVGQSIGILGQGFTGTKSVSFNGTPAQFDVLSGTYLTATVPQGATTGFVTVATPGGKLKSSKRFHFQQ